MRLPKTIVILVLSFLASAAVGSEQSKRLYSRGLVEFNKARYAQALALFEQAVQADPTDYYAVYYRGVTHGRMHDLTAAIADLRTVTTKEASIKQALMELGVALVQSGASADAVPYLERAQEVRPLEGQASLFLGIAQLRLEQFDAARRSFDRAAAADPNLRLSVTYYKGVVDYRQGHSSEAAAQFTSVVRSSPDSEMGHEAAQFLEKIRQGEGASYQVYGLVGVQYDSNVALTPADETVKQTLKISGHADGRATIETGGSYVPWRSERARFSVGYDFYQSLHFKHDEFNLQDHRPSAQVVGRVGFAELGLLARYDYYLLRTDSFLQDVTALPWVALPEGDVGRTEIFFRERRRDSFKRAFHVFDGLDHSPGVRQVLYLGSPDRYVYGAYRFDRHDPGHDDSSTKAFGYDGHQVDAGVDWIFFGQLTTELGYTYRHEEYDSASQDRRDSDHEALVLLREQFTEHLAIIAAYLGTFDNSNKAEFAYERHIGSLALEVRL